MRNAPSVVYPVGRCAFQAGMLCLLGALGLAVLLMWWWPWWGAADPVPRTVRWAGGLGVLLWLAWAGVAWRSWVQTPQGFLQWDAQGAPASDAARAGVWRWHLGAWGEGVPLHRVERVLDLQTRCLVRVRLSSGEPLWLWAEHERDPARWNDLRRALVRAS